MQEDGEGRSFQPMNINYGLLPSLAVEPRRNEAGRRMQPAERGRAKKRAMSERAMHALKGWAASDRLPEARDA